VGVVLKADDKSSRTTGRARDNMIGKVAKAKAKRRFTRNTTRVIDVDAEEERDMDDAMDVDESSVDPATIRTLVPVSQFSSFVLWHADHPVDEGRDEYFRSLTEWTRLAHEVPIPFFPLYRMKC
jgi:ribonuclease H2 subunit C